QPVYVGEPSVEDTIAILRGLKERYEVHHGVRITDLALVAAATLSHRYISDRFLPDKAIDLVDEAASRLRIEIDSMPTELDETERRLRQLEVELQALKKEKDDASVKRRERIEAEIATLREGAASLRLQWENEKKVIHEIQGIKARIDEAHTEEQKAEREGDLEKVARIRYGTMNELKGQLDARQQELKDVQKERGLLKEDVEADDVAEVVSKWTGIPVSRMLESEREKLLKMEERLRERVVGQDDAIRVVSDAIRRERSGLSDPRRPVGSFIFLGPTGVGKTELCRALAEFLFDDEDAMVRVDMSEFMEKHSVARLIGAPPGYVGYEEGGRLTEAVRRRPYSVILLDEINTVVIMTSNIASQWIQEFAQTGGDEEELKRRIQQALRDTFRPEFLNRIDETILFHKLTRDDLKKIVELQLTELSKRLAEQHIGIELSEAAKDLLIEMGYDPVFGARPLKRTIQREIQNPLAKDILEGKYPPETTIKVDVDKQKHFTFK
ncbi:MAG: Clp protease ClpB, partial [Planctomycetes bacterium SM23_65]